MEEKKGGVGGSREWGKGGGMGEEWGGEWGTGRIPVEGSGAVEELEVEGGRGLTVDFSAGAGLHGHCSLFFWLQEMEGGMSCVCVGFGVWVTVSLLFFWG